MESDATDFLKPKILVLDDERQIHSSLRLRLYKICDLTFCFDAADALVQIGKSTFDLCFVDLNMPRVGGFDFIAEARRRDPLLGYVILSAFDSAENLRRTIPLQVFDFIGKPFPERIEFESRIPEWVSRTRIQRRERKLANTAAAISRNLTAAVSEREVEFVASEAARDVLEQISNLITTIHAHLVTGSSSAPARLRADPNALTLLRNVEAARKAADLTATVAERFFSSAYGNRATSPATVNSILAQAVQIALRITGAEAANKMVDLSSPADELVANNLSGIEFLHMVVPAIAIAIHLAQPNTTVEFSAEAVDRLDQAYKLSGFCDACWFNRKQALLSRPGVLLKIIASASAISRGHFEAWINREEGSLSSVSSNGLMSGLQKSQGVLGLSTSVQNDRFRLLLALPVSV